MEKTEITLAPNWRITAELWINCSKCNFYFLIPLVAMEHEQDNSEVKETKKSFLEKLKHMFSPKEDTYYGIQGFMWFLTKFCKKCKTVYVAKDPDNSIELKDKYWEEFKDEVDHSVEFKHYIRTNTKKMDLHEENKCKCGDQLTRLSNSCPICSEEIRLSHKDIDGIPIMGAN